MVHAENGFPVEQDGGVFTIRLGATTELDLNCSRQVYNAVVRTAGDAACRAVVFDIGQADFMDCATAGALIRAHGEVRELGKPFVLDMTEVAAPLVVRLVDLVHLDERLFIAR